MVCSSSTNNGGRREHPGTQHLLRVLENDSMRLHPVVCTSCQHQFHRQCTGISRYSKRQLECFLCATCGGTDSSTTTSSTTTSVEPQQSLPCAVCRATIRRDQRPIRCETCDAAAHRSCLGLQRSASNTNITWHYNNSDCPERRSC